MKINWTIISPEEKNLSLLLKVILLQRLLLRNIFSLFLKKMNFLILGFSNKKIPEVLSLVGT